MYALKDMFNIKNVRSFVEGNLNYFWDKWMGLPPHIQEQVKYRLNNCKEDCVPQGKCIICSCPTYKKVFASESCNKDRHPNFMNNEDWERYKNEKAVQK